MSPRTKHRAVAVFAGIAALACANGAARGQDREEQRAGPPSAPPPAPLQLGIRTGYAYWFGGADRDGVPNGGLDLSVLVDRPWTPSLSLGANVDFIGWGLEGEPNATSLAAGFGATYHFQPTSAGDPWLRLGAGYRLLWINDPPGSNGVTTMRHGFQVLTLRLGYDVRIVEGVAIAPVIGGEVNAFLWEEASDDTKPLAAADFEAFGFVGVQGRFDVGGGARPRNPASTTGIRAR